MRTQILDNSHPKYNKLDPRQFHGSAYCPGKTRILEADRVNQQEVIVRNSFISVFLNDNKILDTDLNQQKSFMANKKHPGISNEEGHFGFAGIMTR